MVYNKPTISVLGEALVVIQGTKLGPVFDGPPPYGATSSPPPTYEVDE